MIIKVSHQIIEIIKARIKAGLDLFQIFKAFAILTFFLVASCLVEPIDENFQKVVGDTDPIFRGSLYYAYDDQRFFPMTDTVWAYNLVYLSMQGGAVYDYEISLDHEVIRPFSGSSNDYTLLIGDLPPGSYSLGVKQLAKSGTKSLADKAGAEYVAYDNNYVLTVRASRYTPVITSVQNINGTVRISWPKFGDGNFEGFRLLKFDMSGLGFEPSYRIITIDDRSATHFDDTTYVGGVVAYKLEVLEGGQYSASEQKEFYLEYNPRMTLGIAEPGLLRLSWRLPPFKNNVHHYQVRRNSTVIQDNISPTEPSIEFTGTQPYGITQNFILKAVSKVPDGVIKGLDSFSYSEDIAVGERLTPFRIISHSKSDQVFYLNYQPTFTSGVLGYFKVDENFNTLDSVVYPFDIYESLVPVTFYMSADGQLLYQLKDYSIEQRNVNSLADKVTWSLPAVGLPNYPYEPFLRNENFAVSNSNFLLLRLYDFNKYTAYVVNMNSRQTVFSLVNPGATHLSSNGQYFINNNVMYKFNGTTYLEDFTLPYTGVKYAQFVDENPEEVVLLLSDKVVRFNCDTQTEIIAWDCNPNSHASAHLDQSGKKLMFMGVTSQMVLDLQTGVIRSLETSSTLTLENNVLFHNRGFGVKNY